MSLSQDSFITDLLLLLLLVQEALLQLFLLPPSPLLPQLFQLSLFVNCKLWLLHLLVGQLVKDLQC
jgi:hypothetical protein